MKLATKLEKARAESPEFRKYAEYMLEEVPDMSMPMLRECFKHNASAKEYRAALSTPPDAK